MKKDYIGKITGLMAVAMALVVSANAAMVPYTGGGLGVSAVNVTTAGVVGTIGGTTGQGQGNWAFESGAAQVVLNLGLGGSGTYGGESTYANNVYDYSGTVNLLGTTLSGGAANTTVPAGWNFVIAKYDGQQAGYVLFYLGGDSQTIPVYPANYWTTNPNQYGISGWTAFNAVPEPTTMIAGALLLLPFAASTIRLIRKNRTA